MVRLRTNLAMPSKVRKLLVSVCVSGVFLALLFLVVDPAHFDLSRLQPNFLPYVVVSYGFCVVFRAASLRALAPVESRGRWPRWLRLATRHQVVFSLAPSGIGDIGFPLFARRYTEVATPDALRMIAGFRLRDAIIILYAVVIAYGLQRSQPLIGVLGFAALLITLYRTDVVLRFLIRGAAMSMPWRNLSAYLKTCVPAEEISCNARRERMYWPVLTWMSATAAVWSGFAAVGWPVSVGETLMILAVLNLIGALALSIAGLGVAEAGVAAALLGMGAEPLDAVAIALMVRPLLLVSMLTACAALELVTLLSLRRAGTFESPAK